MTTDLSMVCTISASGPSESPDIAIEVVRVLDTNCTLVWKKGPAKGARHLSVDGDWVIEISAKTMVEDLEAQLETTLSELGERGIQDLKVDECLQQTDPAQFNALDSAGIRSIYRSPSPGSGKAYFVMGGKDNSGEMVNTSGQGISRWLAEYLRADSRKDILFKLNRSRARSCHAFVILTLADTPFPVMSYFLGALDPLPRESPDLPPPLTAAWLMPSWSANGLYWNGRAWQAVDACNETAAPLEEI